MALEAFDMFKLLFFLLQLELFFVGATICKMSHLMAIGISLRSIEYRFRKRTESPL